IRVARGHDAVDGEPERRVLLQIAGDVAHLARIGGVDAGTVVIEPEVPVRAPALAVGSLVLRAAQRALRSPHSGLSGECAGRGLAERFARATAGGETRGHCK